MVLWKRTLQWPHITTHLKNEYPPLTIIDKICENFAPQCLDQWLDSVEKMKTIWNSLWSPPISMRLLYLFEHIWKMNESIFIRCRECIANVFAFSLLTIANMRCQWISLEIKLDIEETTLSKYILWLFFFFFWLSWAKLRKDTHKSTWITITCIRCIAKSFK